MRSFIGLDLAATDKLAIERWRDKALPSLDKPVPAANFHITLAFLGQINQQIRDELCNMLDEVQMQPVNVKIDQLGYWPKPKILFLGTSNVPVELAELADKIGHLANYCNIHKQHKDYVPHITLVRKVSQNPPCAIIEPDFELRFKQFHLFESVSGKQGVYYPIRRSWELLRSGK